MYELKEPLLIDCTTYFGVVPAGFKASSSDHRTIAIEHYQSNIDNKTPGYSEMGLSNLKHFYRG